MTKLKKVNGKPKNLKALIVDDEPNILMSLDYLFRKGGFTVFVARDGREALDIIQQESLDLVLLDIMMPEVDGYEVCDRIKKDPDKKNIKVIFLSAKISEAEIEKGYAHGAELYVTKPFSTRELMKKVNELFESNVS
jgi:CheY-like chemotaxis protein